jgi:hypothetical protein
MKGVGWGGQNEKERLAFWLLEISDFLCFIFSSSFKKILEIPWWRSLPKKRNTLPSL